MNGGRGPSYSDAETLKMWMDRGILHPPMVTLGWPGACAKVVVEPVTVDRLRWHIWMDHSGWHQSTRKLERLVRWHDEMHTDVLWSHVSLPGELIHVHSGTDMGDDDEWEW